MNKNINKKHNPPVTPIASVLQTSVAGVVKPMLGVSLGLFALTLVAGTIGLNTTTTSADTSFTDDVSITVSAVCNMTSTIDTAHSATITPGLAFTENIGTTNVSATCNDPYGYSVYAVGYTGDTIGNTNLEGTDTGNTGINIASRSYDSSYTDTSYWSMKLTAGQGTDAATIIDSPINYSNYVAVPNAYDKVATKTSATTGSSEASFTTTYGAYATTTQTAGTYNGKVKYTLVHPNTAPAPFVPQPVVTNSGYISYNTNAPTTEVADTMGDQSISNTATSANLWASNFQRPGYGFAGWNTAPDYSGTSYGPNETITFTAGQYSGTNPGLSLYAIWIPSAGDLQSWTGCSSLTKANEVTSPSDILTQSLTALTDTRDNNTYAVAKLADGNCWMIENLRLADQTTSGTPITLNSTNTNKPISTFTQLGASKDPTSTAWCTTDSSACDDQSMLFSGNTTNPVANMTSGDANIYSYGNYYNWYSATAGNGTYSETSGNTAGDICPIGWHLPTGTSSGEFYVLNTVINSGATNTSLGLRKYPANFVYSGYAYGSSVNYRSTNGFYWSSTAVTSDSAYNLSFDSSSVYPGTGYNLFKYFGRMARCMISGS